MRCRWIVALAVLLAASEALAQFGGGGFGGFGGAGRSRGGGSRGQPQERQDKPHVQQEAGINLQEQRIEELRVDLKLQPTQVPLWETYVDKVRLHAGDLARERMQPVSATQMTALKRIDRAVDSARNRLAALEEIAEAAKALYATFTPEQQAVADLRLAALLPSANGTLPQAPAGSAPPRQGVGGSP